MCSMLVARVDNGGSFSTHDIYALLFALERRTVYICHAVVLTT